jgi:hypothetical protein
MRIIFVQGRFVPVSHQVVSNSIIPNSYVSRSSSLQAPRSPSLNQHNKGQKKTDPPAYRPNQLVHQRTAPAMPSNQDISEARQRSDAARELLEQALTGSTASQVPPSSSSFIHASSPLCSRRHRH